MIPKYGVFLFILFYISSCTESFLSFRNEDLIIPKSMTQDFGCTVVLKHRCISNPSIIDLTFTGLYFHLRRCINSFVALVLPRTLTAPKRCEKVIKIRTYTYILFKINHIKSWYNICLTYNNIALLIKSGIFYIYIVR